jgi:hypothetical protein
VTSGWQSEKKQSRKKKGYLWREKKKRETHELEGKTINQQRERKKSM